MVFCLFSNHDINFCRLSTRTNGLTNKMDPSFVIVSLPSSARLSFSRKPLHMLFRIIAHAIWLLLLFFMSLSTHPWEESGCKICEPRRPVISLSGSDWSITVWSCLFKLGSDYLFMIAEFCFFCWLLKFTWPFRSRVGLGLPLYNPRAKHSRYFISTLCSCLVLNDPGLWTSLFSPI